MFSRVADTLGLVHCMTLVTKHIVETATVSGTEVKRRRTQISPSDGAKFLFFKTDVRSS